MYKTIVALILTVFLNSCTLSATPKPKAIFVKNKAVLAKLVRTGGVEGREIKSDAQFFLKKCAVERQIDPDSAAIYLNNKSIQSGYIYCEGNLSTLPNGDSFVQLPRKTTKLQLPKGSTLSLLRFNEGDTAVFLPEGYKLKNSGTVPNGDIGINMIKTNLLTIIQ